MHRIFPHRRADEVPQLDDVAHLIKDGKAKRVMVMAGAGISTAAGIPDFRSPGTGLYDNLAQYDLPYAEAIFDIDYLEDHPEAFYTLAKELYPGNFKPTTSHYFFRLLQDKGILHGLWSQNIDTLERLAGVEEERLVEAHGSFATAKCVRCGNKYDKDDIKPQIMRGEVARCQEKSCKGRRDALIKPEIVFFGKSDLCEGLPDKFFSRMKDFSSCDLLIVVGTSLTVGPFNSLMHRVPSSCPRLLINLESVGEIEHPHSSIGFDFEGKSGKPIRDVRKLAKADEAFEELCELLGWADELRAVREEGWRALDGDAPAGRAAEETPEERQKEVLAAVDAKLEPKAAEPEQDQDRDVDALAQAVSEVELNNPEARPPAGVDETDERKKEEMEAPAAPAKKATL
ncbi:Sir2 histone deacetylase Hst2 [Rhodotorula mucilaginosa]|uniref:NAD-dependent protein deacetylase n=1 Tax=Rhodotorula mucilaginosa TaxID=5537 RepID=A0A9P7BAK4_RHOMI|nr:Sir2 histone deacetylase Hst2 [Rhodotorula mucilaginosa]